ncbi:MAG: FliO/MopB family protein [Phycisphaerales bacterium JB043]
MRITLCTAICCALALPTMAQRSNSPLDIDAPTVVPFLGPGLYVEQSDDEQPAQNEQDEQTQDDLTDEQADTQPATTGDQSESQSLPPIEQQPLGTPPSTQQQPASPLSNLSIVVQTLIALGIVIALALVLRFIMRAAAGRTGSLAGQLTAAGRAPSGVISILGRYPVARGQTLVLLKLDRRILLLCQTPSGFTTLDTISDPDEVASILTRTEDGDGNTMTQQFREALHIAEKDPDISGDGTLELPDNPFQINADETDTPQVHVPLDPVASLKKRLEQLGGSSA